MFYANELKLLKHLLRFVHIIITIKQPSLYYIFEREGARYRVVFDCFGILESIIYRRFPQSRKQYFYLAAAVSVLTSFAAARHPARSIREAATADTVAVIDTRGNDDDATAAAAEYK